MNLWYIWLDFSRLIMGNYYYYYYYYKVIFNEVTTSVKNTAILVNTLAVEFSNINDRLLCSAVPLDLRLILNKISQMVNSLKSQNLEFFPPLHRQKNRD